LSNQTAADFLEDIEESRSKVEKLKTSNKARLDNLANQGIMLGPDVLAMLKVEALVDTIMTTEEGRLIYDHNVEQAKKKFIDDLMKEIRQMQLTQGVAQAKSKLITPGK
jgi:hypothetical protein